MRKRKYRSLRAIYGGHFGPQNKPEINPESNDGSRGESSGGESEITALTTEIKPKSKACRRAKRIGGTGGGSGITALTTEAKGCSREERSGVESGSTALNNEVSSGSGKGFSGSDHASDGTHGATACSGMQREHVGTEVNGFSGNASSLHPPVEHASDGRHHSISGSDSMKILGEGGNGGSKRENVSCCLSSANRISEVEKAINDHPSSCSLSGAPLSNVDADPKRKLNISSKDFLKVYSKTSDLDFSSLRDSCAGPSSLKGERSGYSEEQVQSSFARENTSQTSSLLCDEHSSPGSLQVDTGNNREQSADAAKCSNNLEPLNVLTKVVEEAETGKAIIESVPTANTDFVKVCDICGDIGKEHLLALCRKCNDGAQHTYCMHVKLQKVPEGDWMCEECALSEETEKKKPEKTEKGLGALMKISSNEAKKNPQHPSASRLKGTLHSDTKGSGLGKFRAHKASSPRSLSAKSPSGSREATSTRKWTVGNITRPSCVPSSKRLKPLLSGQASGTALKPPKPPVSTGPRSKSKSFSSPSSKQKVQLSGEGNKQMLNFARETAGNHSKEGASRSMLKSSSFNDATLCGRNNTNVDRKAPPPKLRLAKRSLPCAKTEKILTSAANSSPAIEKDENVTAPEKTSNKEPPMSNHQDLPDKKRYIESNNALESAAEKNKGSVDDVRDLVVYSGEEASATNANNSNAVVRFEENSSLRDGALFVSLKDISPQISAALPEPYHSWQGRFEISTGDKLPIECDGVQAHLSCLASRKVLDMAKKLPQKLEFVEMPRISMWPPQFVGSHASEENISLYFFAKDPESYDKSYKNLVGSMMKKDVGLKGNVRGFEFLVFSSNLLPEKAQRWNNLFFLWGVFKGKKTGYSDKLAISCSKGEPLEQDPPAPAISADNAPATLVSFGQSNENTTSLIDILTLGSGKIAEVQETKGSPSDQKLFEDVQTGQQVDLLGTPMKIESSGDMPPADSSERERWGVSSKRGLDIDLNSSLEETPNAADAEHPSKRLKHSIGEMEESRSFKGVIGPSSSQIPSFASLGSGNDENRFKFALQQQAHPGNEHHWLSSRFLDLELSLSLPKPEPDTTLSLSLPIPSMGKPGASSSSTSNPEQPLLPWRLK